MRPGPEVWQQSQISEHERPRPETGRPPEASLSLSDEQRRLIAVLQTQQEGMTIRQLESRLSWPRKGVQSMLESLLECRLVARLNTIVPSYIYRYNGMEIDAG